MPAFRLAQFTTNIQRSRDLVGLGQSIGGMTNGLVDATDLNRAGLTQAVAAVDAYFHGVVLDRGVDILMGRLPVSGTSTKMGLDFAAVANLLAAGTPADRELAARTGVAQRLSFVTMQNHEEVAAALAAVGVPKIWTTAFGAGAEGAKTSLGLIVTRRNRIVHSCDVDPLVAGGATPLSDVDALLAIATITQTVHAIDPFC